MARGYLRNYELLTNYKIKIDWGCFMAEFKRKKGESFESFLRRFNKGLKNSKRLNLARGKMSFNSKKSKREQKQYALRSLELRGKREYLRKTGKLVEENPKKTRR